MQQRQQKQTFGVTVHKGVNTVPQLDRERSIQSASKMCNLTQHAQRAHVDMATNKFCQPI